jgi:hypothetical protein
MPVMRKVTFFVWIILTLLVGAALLIAPGRFLDIFGWQPVEPILDRILGASLLAMSWLSLRGWLAIDSSVTMLIAEIQAIFCALAALGVLRHLLGQAHYPLMVWIVFAVTAAFAALWFVVRVSGKARA